MLLIIGAELGDVAQKEIESCDLDKRQPNNSEELGTEHGSGRDFHLEQVSGLFQRRHIHMGEWSSYIVSDLHIRDKGEAVGHEHVTPALEQHHRNRSAR